GDRAEDDGLAEPAQEAPPRGGLAAHGPALLVREVRWPHRWELAAGGLAAAADRRRGAHACAACVLSQRAYRYGRARRVCSTACSCRQRATRPWSPDRSTSGTARSANTGGRVYCGYSSSPSEND